MIFNPPDSRFPTQAPKIPKIPIEDNQDRSLRVRGNRIPWSVPSMSIIPKPTHSTVLTMSRTGSVFPIQRGLSIPIMSGQCCQFEKFGWRSAASYIISLRFMRMEYGRGVKKHRDLGGCASGILPIVYIFGNNTNR